MINNELPHTLNGECVNAIMNFLKRDKPLQQIHIAGQRAGSGVAF